MSAIYLQGSAANTFDASRSLLSHMQLASHSRKLLGPKPRRLLLHKAAPELCWWRDEHLKIHEQQYNVVFGMCAILLHHGKQMMTAT